MKEKCNIEKGMYVLTQGIGPYKHEIEVGIIQNIMDEDKKITCWRGTDELEYEDSMEFITIPEYTAVWVKDEDYWVFRFEEDGTSCCSTQIIAASFDLKDINKKIMELFAMKTVNLTYFKSNGDYYGCGDYRTAYGMMYQIIYEIGTLIKTGSLPGIYDEEDLIIMIEFNGAKQVIFPKEE